MNKSQIFKAAHKLAKSVHVAGDCYRVTFGAALKIVIAESKAPSKIESLLAIGSEWVKGDIHRIYFNNLAQHIGLDVSFYKTGNVSSANIFGESISNTKARQLLNVLEFGKVFFDVKNAVFAQNGKLPKEMFEQIVYSIKISVNF